VGAADWVDRASDNPTEWGTSPRNKPGTAYQSRHRTMYGARSSPCLATPRRRC